MRIEYPVHCILTGGELSGSTVGEGGVRREEEPHSPGNKHAESRTPSPNSPEVDPVNRGDSPWGGAGTPAGRYQDHGPHGDRLTPRPTGTQFQLLLFVFFSEILF